MRPKNPCFGIFCHTANDMCRAGGHSVRGTFFPWSIMSRGILSWIHLIRGSLLNFMVQRMTERNVGRTRLIGFSSVLLDITPKSRKPCGRAISVCLTGRKKSIDQSSSNLIQSVSALVKRSQTDGVCWA